MAAFSAKWIATTPFTAAGSRRSGARPPRKLAVLQTCDHPGREESGWGRGVGLAAGLFAPPRLVESAMLARLGFAASVRRVCAAAAAVVGISIAAILGLILGFAGGCVSSRSELVRIAADPRFVGLGRPCGGVSRHRGLLHASPGRGLQDHCGGSPHSTTMSFAAYDDYGLIASPANVLNEYQMVPNRGSVNPFLVGAKVNASRRNYTAWLWPDSEPVPPELHNVIVFPTKPTDPTDTNGRFSMVMRMYRMQPGYTRAQFFPTIRAVATANWHQVVRCPLSPRSHLRQLAESFAGWLRDWGPAQLPPEPTGNQLLFSRPPALFVPYPEGYSSDGAGSYLGSRVDLAKISVITWHKVPTYFNNQMLRPRSVMGDYQARYMSLTVLHFPESKALSVNSDNAIYQQDGSWVTVLLPSQPRLPSRQLRAARARAKRLGYNVIQLPQPNLLSRVVPEQLAVRMKVPNPTFCCSIAHVPSWVDPNNPATAGNNYRDWDEPKDASFFDTYVSNSTNMGQYYIDGVEETYSTFIQREP